MISLIYKSFERTGDANSAVSSKLNGAHKGADYQEDEEELCVASGHRAT